jgi:hypothetical protein
MNAANTQQKDAAETSTLICQLPLTQQTQNKHVQLLSAHAALCVMQH